MTPIADSAGLGLRELLIDLEYVLRDTGLWSDERPSDWAFASELPFAHDRMSFPLWLQYVFLPTLSDLAESDRLWPEDCAVAPMVELQFGPGEATRLLQVIRQIDQLVSRHQNAAESIRTDRTE